MNRLTMRALLLTLLWQIPSGYADGTSDKAIFRVYLKALHDVGFHDAARSKDKIVSAVAEFLFGDKEALKGAL